MPHALPEHLARVAEAAITQILRDWPTQLAARRAACLGLGLHGLRGQEVCNLNRGDLDSARLVLTVHTIKRGHNRCIAIDPFFAHSLSRVNSGAKRGDPLIALPSGRRLTRQAIFRYGRWLRRLLTLPDQACSFHSLRHTAAHRVYTRTGDVFLVHRMLGHKTLRQTHIYLSTTTPVPIEVGPTFAIHSPAPALHVYPGPMDDVERAESMRRRLLECRLPPARGISSDDHQTRSRSKRTTNTIKQKLAGLAPLERERIIREIITAEWPRPGDPTDNRGKHSKRKRAPPEPPKGNTQT